MAALTMVRSADSGMGSAVAAVLFDSDSATVVASRTRCSSASTENRRVRTATPMLKRPPLKDGAGVELRRLNTRRSPTALQQRAGEQADHSFAARAFAMTSNITSRNESA